MLNLFLAFTPPEAPYVRVYFDDQQPELLHAVAQKPTVAFGRDGRPIFGLVSTSEGGLLNADFELAVSSQTMKLIQNHIRNRASAETIFRPSFSGPSGIEPMRVDQPMRLVFADWIDSQATLTSDGETLAQVRPSLFGNNRASFGLMLANETAKMIEQDVRGRENPRYRIHYVGRFRARTPGVRLIVHVSAGAADKLRAGVTFEQLITEGEINLDITAAFMEEGLGEKTHSLLMQATQRMALELLHGTADLFRGGPKELSFGPWEVMEMRLEASGTLRDLIAPALSGGATNAE